MRDVLEQFAFPEAPLSWEPYGTGHINRTYLVTLQGGGKYILQRISDALTKDAKGLMENIARVTDHLKKKEPDPRRVLSLVKTRKGEDYLAHESGNWRVYRFVEDSICLQRPESDEDLRQSALAFGLFEQMLADFPAQTLHETLKGFHNTPQRYQAFREAIRADRAGRGAQTGGEIRFLLEREERAGRIQAMLDHGELPLRVTHNDTKLDNILFDATTRKALCIIDLDTVMPGSSLYDFGDSIRFGAATAAEDEKDLSRVHLDLHLYEVFREGFAEACPDLTERERTLLPLGAWTITTEQAVRFLGDHLNGDIYYHTRYPGQNLDRARTQIRLAEEMEQYLF